MCLADRNDLIYTRMIARAAGKRKFLESTYLEQALRQKLLKPREEFHACRPSGLDADGIGVRRGTPNAEFKTT